MSDITLRQWLAGQLFGRDDFDGKPLKIIVTQITPDQREGANVAEMKVPAKFDQDWLDGAVEDLESETHNDATALGTHQAYQVVVLFKGEGGKKVKGPRRVVRIDGRPKSEAGDSLSTEPPTQIGLVAQAQRHTEAIARSAYVHTSSIMARYETMLEKRDGLIDKLLDDKMHTLELMETLTQHKHERELEAKREEHMHSLKKESFDMLLTLAPTVVNRLAGKDVLKEKSDPLVLMVRGLVANMSPEQMTTFLDTLSPPQRVVMLEIVQSVVGGSAGTGDKGPPRLTAIQKG